MPQSENGGSLTVLCEYLNMIEYAAVGEHEYGPGQSGAERDS